MTNDGDIKDYGNPVSEGASPDPFEVAFKSVFCSVSTLFRESGIIRNHIIGLEFRQGRAVDTQIEVIRTPERTAVLIERMRRRWSMVAHVQLTDAAPDQSGRTEIAAISIYGADDFAFSHCVLDPRSREMTRGELTRRHTRPDKPAPQELPGMNDAA